MAKEKTFTKLKCQICGEEIVGDNEEDAMEKLRQHMETTHKEENPSTRLKPWLERTD